MPILSTNIQSLAGVVSINIEHPNTAVYIDLLSMGTIDYEFDLVPTQEVTSYIGGIPGACSVTLRDDMSNRGSFFDSMESYIGDYDGSVALSVPSANVDLTLTSRQTGNVYTFPFQIKFSDIGLDERSRTASVKLQPRQPQINLGTWRDERLPIINTFPSISLPYVFEAFTYFSTPENTCPVGDVIYDLVGTLSNTPLHSNIYETAVNIGTVLVENARYGTVTAPLAAFPRQQLMANQGNGSVIASFMANGTSTQEYNPNKPMSEFLNQYAGMEGAIFGSAFDVNFYINRTINTYNVELSKVDVADLKFVSIPRSYNTVVFNTDKEPTFPDGVEIENANVVFQGWLDAQQQAKIAFRNLSPYIVVGCFEEDLGVVYNFTYVNNSGPIEDNSAINNTWVDSIFTRAYSAYAGALGLTSTNRGSLKIDVDILGVEKIRPYEVIKFDNTVPLRYQGKHFRPTSLSYDLKADRVRVSAYQISAFEVVPPEPPPPPPEFDGIFAVSNYKYLLEESEIANNLIVFNENGSRNTSFSDKYFGKDVMVLVCEELSSNRLGVINALSQFIVYESSGEVEIIVDLADLGFNLNTSDFNNNVNFMGYNIKETNENDYILSIRTKTTNTPSYNAVIKILADGSMDENFVPYTYVAAFATDQQYIASIQLQSNGKIIVAGTDNISEKGLLLRLDTDGTEDVTFNKITWFLNNMNNIITDIKVLSDDSILVVGDFTEYDEESYGRIIKLDADGDLVASFNEDGSGFNAIVRQIEVNTTTNIITVSGDFTSYNGTACPSIVKLNPDGSLNTFFTYDEIANVYYKRLCVLSDGSIVIGYLPENDPFNYKINFAKIDDDGSVDTTFQSIELRIAGQGFESKVYGLVEISGKLFIGGSFSIYNVSEESNKTADDGYFDNDKRALLFFDNDGEITSTFFDDTDLGGGVTNKNIGIQSNGKYIYGYNRFNADGTIDDTFTVQTGTANIICVQEDDKILVYDGSILERLLEDGTLDTAFNTNAASAHTEFESIVFIGLDSTNKIFIGGLVDSSIGDIKIIRLNADGTTDNTYEFEYNVGGAITDFYCAVDPLDRVVVACGLFNITIEDAEDIVPVVIRVSSSGVLDSTFTLSESMLVLPSAVSVQSDSKIIIYGQQLKYFSNYVAPTEPVRQSFGTGIARLNANGTIDTSFTVPSLIRNSSLFGYTNGKVVSGNDVVLNGDFSFYNTTIGGGIALLGSNGTRINSFNQKVIYPIIWNSAFL